MPTLRGTIVKPEHLLSLWYENEVGDKVYPDLKHPYTAHPEGYTYQHSLSCGLHHSVLKITQQSEVDECDHPDEYVVRTGGWIDEYKGRRCTKCNGSQSCTIEEFGIEWPDKWEATGSVQLGTGEASWWDDLVTAMVRGGKGAREAVFIAAQSCERCMNALAHEYGLPNGYPEFSKQWHDCNTECQFCHHLLPGKYVRVPGIRE